MPRLQVRTRTGRWAVLHASWMSSGAGKTIAVILQEAAPAEVAPLIMTAFGLTDRGVIAPGRRADLVLVDGDPTRDISATRNIRGVWIGGSRVK